MREEKLALRRKMRHLLGEITEANAALDSARICSELQLKTVWQSAGIVMLYVPLKGEVNVLPLIEPGLVSGKVICFPRFERATNTYRPARLRSSPDEFLAGPFGVLEPAPSAEAVPLNQLDLILVPGLAFDMCGHRLGRGKGYYDRLLAAVAGAKCAVAFDRQILESVPAEPHDVLMNAILTPTRWIFLSRCSA